jgi:EEF1A lysine methyltransferase 4
MFSITKKNEKLLATHTTTTNEMDDLCLSPETLAALQAFRDEARNSSEPQQDPQVNESSSESMIASNNALYKTKEYWDERFQKEETYDWLLTYQQIKSSISQFLRPDQTILIIGCGNSTFSADLYDDGFHNIVNIDFSKIVIDRMSEANKSRPHMTWLDMDMCDLTFDDASFDVVIDKATMDALLVDEGSVWEPDPGIIASVDRMCRGVSRILSSQGVFLQISFSQPHFRTKYLMGQHVQQTITDPYSTTEGLCPFYQWTLSVAKIGIEAGCLDTFLYSMVR